MEVADVKRWAAVNYHSRLLAASLSIYLTGAPAQTPQLLPAAEEVAGASQAEWSKLWWQWAASFDRMASPVSDQTGALCSLKQSGPVWYLAGTYGTHRTVRECTVPRDKYLFFPLINYIVVRGVNSKTSCLGLMSQAAQMTNDAASLVLEVDGIRSSGLVAHRQAPSGRFDVSALSEKPVNIPAAANGYYVMLRPLSPGVHTLNFGGALPSMLQGVTYTLRVE